MPLFIYEYFKNWPVPKRTRRKILKGGGPSMKETRHENGRKSIAKERIADATIGEEMNVLRQLNSTGVSREQFVAIGNDENLRQVLAGTTRWMTLFSSPEKQIERMLDLNKSVWHDPGITKEKIERIGPPPFCPAPIYTKKEKRFYCLFLFYEFSYESKSGKNTNPIKTFWRYWEAMKYVFGEENLAFADDYWEEETKKMVRPKKKRTISFVEGSIDRHEAGFSWRLVELYRFIEIREAREARKKVFEISRDLCPRGLGHEILALPLMHPNWMLEADMHAQWDSQQLWFGLQPVLALELNMVSEKGRTYIPQLLKNNGIIYFKPAAGSGTRCPAYYKQMTPRYYHNDSLLPRGD